MTIKTRFGLFILIMFGTACSDSNDGLSDEARILKYELETELLNDCAGNEECTVIPASCLFDCYTAVNSSHAQKLQEAGELLSKDSNTSELCDCPGFEPEAYCNDQKCELIHSD